MEQLTPLRQDTLKLKITSPDDVWLLSQIITSGDVVTGQTERKIKLGEEKTRVTKRTITLSILVERVEFAQGEHALRVSGKIREGLEDIPAGSYHTITLEQQSVFSLVKKSWPAYQLNRIKEATKKTLPPLLIVVFDREEAFVALLTQQGVEVLAHLSGEVAKKHVQTKAAVKSFYATIIEAMKQYDVQYHPPWIILASPSFWKEELKKELTDAALKKKIIPATCSSVDQGAITEVLSRDETKTALAASRTAQEIKAVELLLADIAKNSSLVVYGFKEVKSAGDAGAIRELLLTDTMLRKYQEEGKYAVLDAFLQAVDASQGKITIISGQHAGGKKLNGLGGIAAFLRYKF